MHIQITNAGAFAVPLTSTKGDGLATELEPNNMFVIDDEAVTVATFGDDPGFLQEFTDGMGKLFDTIRAHLTQFRNRQTSQRRDPQDVEVLCTIENFGPHPLRVVLGEDHVDDYEIEPGETYTAQAPGYIQLRELGA
jgi:hypothetical protein